MGIRDIGDGLEQASKSSGDLNLDALEGTAALGLPAGRGPADICQGGRVSRQGAPAEGTLAKGCGLRRRRITLGNPAGRHHTGAIQSRIPTPRTMQRPAVWRTRLARPAPNNGTPRRDTTHRWGNIISGPSDKRSGYLGFGARHSTNSKTTTVFIVATTCVLLVQPGPLIGRSGVHFRR